jgi:hypothetical protein
MVYGVTVMVWQSDNYGVIVQWLLCHRVTIMVL